MGQKEERISSVLWPVSEILPSDLIHLHIKCARPDCDFYLSFLLVALETMPGFRICTGPEANLQAGFFTLRRQLMGKGWLLENSMVSRKEKGRSKNQRD